MGKGVVATIVPDDKMLRMKDGTVIDIIMSPLAVISRINMSQLYVANLGLISKNLYERLRIYIEAGGENSSETKWIKERELLRECISKLYYENPNISLQQVYEESKPIGFVRIRAGALDKYFTAELVTSLLELLNISDHGELFDPVDYKWVRTPIRVGYQQFFRLHFIAEEKMKATGSVKTLGVQGYGATRKEGQSIGEQESHALLAYGEGDLLRKFSYEKDDKASRFFQEMLSIGLLLKDERKPEPDKAEV